MHRARSAAKARGHVIKHGTLLLLLLEEILVLHRWRHVEIGRADSRRSVVCLRRSMEETGRCTWSTSAG